MSGTAGDEWGGGGTERTAPQPGPPQRTVVDLRPPARPPGRDRWRVPVGLAGAAAIGFGIFTIVSREHAHPPAPAGPSKPAFIARADAICTRLDPVVDGEIERLIADTQDGDLAAARADGSQLVSSTSALVRQISALGFSGDGAATVRLILNEYGELTGALLTGTAEGFAAAESLGQQIAVAAGEFGFRVCGQA